MGPLPDGKNRGGFSGQNPARELANGEGTVGDKLEGLEANLLVGLGLVEVAGAEPSTVAGGRRWLCSRPRSSSKVRRGRPSLEEPVGGPEAR